MLAPLSQDNHPYLTSFNRQVRWSYGAERSVSAAVNLCQIGGLTMLTLSKYHIAWDFGSFCVQLVKLVPEAPLFTAAHQVSDWSHYFTLSIWRVELGLIVF